jgi:hypothetical protein
MQSRGLFYGSWIVDCLALLKAVAAAICRDCHPVALWCVQKELTENVMNRQVNLLFAACLATMVAGAGSEVIAAAEGAAATQDLVNVRAAGQVTASWTRHPDFYALQVVMETSKPGPPRTGKPANLNAEEMRQQGIADAAEALRKLVPQNVPGMPTPNTTGDGFPDRGSIFIANTIANLRGLDPVFGCRTLTLVDGRRVAEGQPPASSAPQAPAASPAPVVQSYPPRLKHPRIEVWLLSADGTQILPAAYTCVVVPAVPAASTSPSAVSRNRSEEFSYRYSVEDSAQAVAVAIRIDSDFYIEKLQSL